MAREQRWLIVKDYYTEDHENFTDTWCILYGTKADAEAAKARLEAGQDKSWYDPEGNKSAGYSAFLYVDSVDINDDGRSFSFKPLTS